MLVNLCSRRTGRSMKPQRRQFCCTFLYGKVSYLRLDRSVLFRGSKDSGCQNSIGNTENMKMMGKCCDRSVFESPH